MYFVADYKRRRILNELTDFLGYRDIVKFIILYSV